MASATAITATTDTDAASARVIPARNAAPARDLTALFSPESIAIVGASNHPGKYGNWLSVRALSGPRPVHLINRTSLTVLGRPTSPSLTAVGSKIDLAIIAVPAAAFDSAIQDAIDAQVSAIVAITAGLGESGPQAAALQRALVRRVRAAGISMVGPNCMGLLDTTSGLDATVNDFTPGTVAIISQSGNLAVDIGGHLADLGMGVSRFVSLGNSADVDAADLIDSCVQHEGTDAIAVYCEGFGDGRKFARSVARAHAAGKPVVLLSVGRGAASTRGAASHTGSMVTSSVVLEAMCESTGAELVKTPHGMAALLQALVRWKAPTGRRVAVLADGGGHGSLMSDSLEDIGMQVEEFGAELSARAAAELPPTAGTVNPVDVAGGGEQDITCFPRVVDVLAASDEVEAVMLTGLFGGYSHYDPAVTSAEIAAAVSIVGAARRNSAPVFVHTVFSDSAPAKALRDGGIPVYRSMEDAAWALARITARAGRLVDGVPEPQSLAPALTETGYWPARRALTDAGITFGRAAEVSTLDDLRAVAADLEFPLVLKALGDEHKSDRGGVLLGIADRDELDAAWTDLQDRLSPPSVSVEEQLDLSDAVELIVGARQDPAFGTIVLVGLGGFFTELFSDIRCELGPVTPKTAKEMLLGLSGSAMLTGFRGRSPIDLDATAELVSSL
ncbi:MAG: acetate--CoA ligase family protein, partial [Allobranchiibius sp.]